MLHDCQDINIIFLVFIGLKRKVFAVPQLSPTCSIKYGSVSILAAMATAADRRQFTSFHFWSDAGVAAESCSSETTRGDR